MSCNTEFFFYRISLLAVSVSCVVFTLGLVGYVYQHRKIKVFKVASPIFLCITLLGCSIMYLEVRLTLRLLFRLAGFRQMLFCVISVGLQMLQKSLQNQRN
jgi:hypothetical protein